jgi:hypothetical protein
MIRSVALACLPLVLTACPRALEPDPDKSSPREPDPLEHEPRGVGAPAVVDKPPAAGAVPLFVDEERVAWLVPNQLGRARPLQDLLPPRARDPHAWVTLEADAEHRRDLFIPRPSESYAGQQARVFAQGTRLTLGMFRPPPAGAPEHVRQTLRAPTVALDGLLLVRVRLEELPRVDDDRDTPAPPLIEIVIDGERVRAVPVSVLGQRGQRKREQRGDGDSDGKKVRPERIGLTEFLRDHAQVTTFKEATLEDVAGEQMSATRADLDSGAVEIKLGRNRRGLVRAFGKGAGLPDNGLRGVRRIELLTR